MWLRRSRSEEVSREFFGVNFHPQWAKWASILGVGELLVFLDYGQLRLAPILENSALQGVGLVLYVVAILWLMMVDAYLSQQFAIHMVTQSLMTTGPYRHLRHPRYSGLIATRIGFALMLASIVGWLFAAGWILLVLRRVKLEEARLVAIFGETYENYARHTARLVPGIY